MAGALLMALACAGPAFARDATVTSFDGTKLNAHFFPSAGGGVAPTVMLGPGWGSPGATDENQADGASSGYTGVGTLRNAGYNVLTWDPRGFGSSEGTVEVDSPDFEGRDAQALIDFIAAQPEAQLDAPGDPRLGMSGASYGGGIQLVTAALDPRVDAIAPVIAWHSLVTSLFKSQTPKTGWANLLYVVASSKSLDPHIRSSNAAAQAGKPVSAADEDFFRTRGPGDLVGRIKVPTLLIQGTVDTLFTPQEAIDNYAILRHNGVPVKMIWFCGGHGACLTNPGDKALTAQATLGWFEQYLKGTVNTFTSAPRFQWIDQDGKTHGAADYPLPAGRALTATGGGTLKLVAAGGSGPAKLAPGADLIATAAAGVAAAKAKNAVDVKVLTPKAGQLVVGAPTVKITYSGKAKATRVLAQIVDGKTGKVLGNQITPIPVKLDGRTHTVTQKLEPVAATTHAGSSFVLQVVAQSTAYNLFPKGGKVALRKVSVTLPVGASR